MLMRSGTWVVAAIALGVAYGLACTAGPGHEPDRFAALEARLSRLEAMLSTDSGPAFDAGTDAPEPVWDPDAGHADHGLAAMRARTPEEQVAECMRMREFVCRHRGHHGPPQTRPSDGGFSWIRPQDVGVDASAAGRKCLEEEGHRCARLTHEAHRRERLRAWLDAQLAPDRVDRALSDSLLSAAERQGHIVPGTVSVDCVTEFCRIAPRPGSPEGGAGGTPLRSICRGSCQTLRFDDTYYTTRDGHQFPD